MSNIVSIDASGYLRQAYRGDQTDQTMSETLAELYKLANKLRKAGKEVYGVVDLSALGNMTPSARKMATEAVRNFPYDKAAIFGGSTFNKSLVSLVLLAAGKSRKIKMFVTEAEALKWLKGAA